MTMDDMVDALATMDEKQRKAMMAARLDAFAGMPEQERRTAMEMMMRAVGSLSERDARKLVKTRTTIICELPDAKRDVLMGSHMSVLQKLGGKFMMTDMNLVESVMPELSSRHQLMVKEMMKMMNMPSMKSGGGSKMSSGSRQTSTGSSNWGYTSTWIVALTGALILISPFVLGFSGDLVATWNDVIFGIGIAVLAGVVAIAKPNLADSSWSQTFMWIVAVSGVWLIVAPFVLTYQDGSGAVISDIVLGIIVTVLSVAVAGGRADLA